MKPTGSFYLHCDPTASHYLKLVLDAVFCGQGGEYHNEIVWKRTGSHNDSSDIGRAHDTIFFYSRTKNYEHNKQYQSYSENYVTSHYRKVDSEGRSYRTDNTTAMGLSGGGYTYKWNGVTKVWRYPIEKMQELHDLGRLYYTRSGTPEFIRYLDEMPGVPLQDVWDDIPPINSQATERMGYPTQKPEALLERIIKASSNEGDVVLDAYCGCGTTIAVAQRLNRKWIGIDITYHSISLMLKRLTNSFGDSVLDNIIIEGIPRDIASAHALANRQDDRVRKEFEKWAALTYTNNRGVINEKKGADKGIDAIVYFATSANETGRMIIQVKSGGANRGTIATLHGDMEREKADMATLITLENPTTPMVEEAKKAGFYDYVIMGKRYDRIQIVTVQEMIEQDRRIDLPLSFDAVRRGKKADEDQQLGLGLN